MKDIRRVRLVYFDQSIMVHILNWMRSPSCEFLQIPDGIDIPADAEVLAVEASTLRRAIGVLFAHPSFDEVPEGAYVPEVGGWDHPWRSRIIENPDKEADAPARG